jgi:uncharacterized protein (TIGR02444 family)
MTDAVLWPANPFWDFSLRLYARAGVAPACLALQERRGIDVNVLLYCIWLGCERGVAIADTDAARITQSIARWSDDVVVPLRVLRTQLKADTLGAAQTLSDALRNDIKRAELAAERIEQQILFTQSWSDAPGASRSTPIARGNVHAYLKSLGIQPNPQDDEDVGIILTELET